MNIQGYQIERELGQGGMSTVYLATQESLHRHVALKIMSAALAADRTFAERFIKEGRTIAQLSHPHIVAIYDIGETENHFYIAMEHVGGGDLKQRIVHGMDSIAALKILRDIAGALGYAHSRGFVHRDVKPANILFRENGTAVLTDFGIAKAIGSDASLTGVGKSIGTPHYMSPEQARGESVDGRSDLYSLGIAFYEMLTGDVPYQGEDTFAVALKHINDPKPILPQHLATWQPLLDGMVGKDPAERFVDAEQLLSAIEPYLSGETPTVYSGGTQVISSISPVAEESQVESTNRNGLYFAIGGALLAVLVIAGGSWLTSSTPLAPPGGNLVGTVVSTSVTMPTATAGNLPARESQPPTKVVPVAPRTLRDPLAGGGQGPELIVVPPGRFLMGDIQGVGEQDEQPVHSVTQKRPFAIGLYEVSIEEFRVFCAATGHKLPTSARQGDDRLPVNSVNWQEANDFVQWLSQQTGQRYRLPSEAEWEYAARAGRDSSYYWGNEAGFGNANCDGCNGRQSGLGLQLVDSGPANPLGIYNALGNVGEWVDDCWVPDYQGAGGDESLRQVEPCEQRTIRGGSFLDGPADIRVSARTGLDASMQFSNLGFRVVRDL